jgi:hypothetical protein
MNKHYSIDQNSREAKLYGEQNGSAFDQLKVLKVLGIYLIGVARKLIKSIIR